MMDIFYGRVTDNLAHLYVRLPRDGAEDAHRVTGWVRGPFCKLSQTLPATIALRDMGPGPTLLGSAAIPDPCFWSTQLPALYEVHVELGTEAGGGEILEQVIGIRRLGATGHNLLWEGKRWVLRAVEIPESLAAAAVDQLLATYREVSAGIYAENPSPALCRGASQQGVVVIARLTDPGDIEVQLAELARFAAVAMVVLPDDVDAAAGDLNQAAPNLLLAQRADDRAAIDAAPWADLIVCRVSDPARFPTTVAACPLPILAERGLNKLADVPQARAACDHLQRDLAPGGDYAGYLITSP